MAYHRVAVNGMSFAWRAASFPRGFVVPARELGLPPGVSKRKSVRTGGDQSRRICGMRFVTGYAAMLAAMLASVPAALASSGGELRVDTVAVEGRAPIWDGARIGVWEMDGDKPGRMVAERHATPAKVALEPGRYRVAIHYQGARSMRDVRVEGGADQEIVLNLNAGEVSLDLLPRMGAAPVDRDLSWSVHHYAPGEGLGDLVASASGRNPTLLLSEGWYEVRVPYNGDTVRHVIQAKAGRQQWYSLLARW